MRFVSVTYATAVVSAIAFLSGGVAPASAGPAYDELDLESPCVRSNDIRPNIVLGGRGDDPGCGQERGWRQRRGTPAQHGQRDQPLFRRGGREQWAGQGLGADQSCRRDHRLLALQHGYGRDASPVRRSLRDDFTPLNTDIRGRPRAITLDGGPPAARVCGGQGARSAPVIRVRSWSKQLLRQPATRSILPSPC